MERWNNDIYIHTYIYKGILSFGLIFRFNLNANIVIGCPWFYCSQYTYQNMHISFTYQCHNLLHKMLCVMCQFHTWNMMCCRGECLAHTISLKYHAPLVTYISPSIIMIYLSCLRIFPIQNNYKVKIWNCYMQCFPPK
jgi:hypothetical protein